MKAKIETLLLSLIMTSSVTLVNSEAKSSCEHMNVAAAKIPYFSENSQKGVFIKLIRNAAMRAGLTLNITVIPKKRAVQFFKNGTSNILMPQSSAGEKIPAYKSTPILIKRDFAFTLRGAPIPASFEELSGLSVGLTLQYSYPKTLTDRQDITFIEAPSDELNLKMLSNNRFDVSIIEERSGKRALAKAGLTNITYDKKHPLAELLVWVLFEKTPCGLIQRQKINEAFAAMKKDGTWKFIFEGPNKQS